MFTHVAHAYGHTIHFWAKMAGAVVVACIGWIWGDIMAVMVAYTLILTVMTDLGTIVIQNSNEKDTAEIKADNKAELAKLQELIRAIPGARS